MDDQSNPLDVVDGIYTNPEPIVGLVKMQAAFWEKLVVLDAATLAASFTASGIFREHLIGDGGVGYLAAAWKLLICGLGLCLLAQWIAIPGVIHISGYFYGMRVLSLLNKSASELRAQGGPPCSEYRSISSIIVAKSPELLSRAQLYPRFAGAIGSMGLLSSLTSTLLALSIRARKCLRVWAMIREASSPNNDL